MRDVDENLLYMLIGIAATILVGVGVYPIQRAHRKRRHAREVWARIEPIWVPLHGRLDHRMRQGGRLIIRNRSDWPVSGVIVLVPDTLHGMDFDVIAPGEERVVELPEATMPGTNADRVVLQFADVRGKLWHWVADEPHLRPPSPPLPLHARMFRLLLDRGPWPRRVARLPRRLRVFLLGEDPLDFV